VNTTNQSDTTRTERRRRHTHDVLLTAGYQIVGELGVAGWPISDVAERADVALGSFYNHFADRDDFVDALIHHYIFAEQRRMLTRFPIDAGDFAFRLSLQFCGLIDRAIDDPVYRAFVVAVGQVNDRRPQALSEEFLDRIDTARTNGEVACGDVAAVLAAAQGLVVTMYRHINFLERQNPGSTDRQVKVLETVRMVLAIVGVAPARIAEITAEVENGSLIRQARELRAKSALSSSGGAH